jgi:uncharacterized protein
MNSRAVSILFPNRVWEPDLMKRNIDNELLKWKKKIRSKPLILRGARQVGKTYSVKKFGASFDSFAFVDFEKKLELHKIFAGDLSASRLIAELELMLGMKIIPGKTLLFFDEIQSCPRAITALRYLYEEMPGLHVLAAGSLLEFALNDISFPVGRIQFMHLQPLCFAEYLEAVGNEIAAEYVRSSPRLLSPVIHTSLCDELRRYFFIGGMPESVKAYIDTGSLQESFEVQAEIIETYRLDFGKYAPRADKLCLNNVLTSVAGSVGQEMAVAQSEPLYYWSRRAKSSSAEVDFLTVIKNRIHPVEVKSGPAGRLKSLHLFLQTYKKCGPGLIFSDNTYAELPEQNLIFLPLYFAYSSFKLRPEQDDSIMSPDSPL